VFETPNFNFWNVAYTAIGAMALWSSWGKTKLRPLFLSRLLRLFLKGRICAVVEFVVFVAIGVVVGIGVVHPNNAQQAITAGLAWTGALARPELQTGKHP